MFLLHIMSDSQRDKEPVTPEQSTSLTPTDRKHQAETPKVLFPYDALLGGV